MNRNISLGKATSVTGGLERRRGDVERMRNQEVQIHRVSGRQLMDGVGEALFDINFPVTFMEIPSFSFGGELDGNLAPVQGEFPTISAIVVKWNTVEKIPGHFHYKGATLCVVTTGTTGHRIWIHWHMEGKAFRNPLTHVGGLDQPL